MQLYKKLLKRIENGEPVYCNESFSKDLADIANNHHKESSKELVEALEEIIYFKNNVGHDSQLMEAVEKAEQHLENHLK